MMCENVYEIKMSRDMIQGRALMNTVMNLRVTCSLSY